MRNMPQYKTAFLIWDANLRGGTEILTHNMVKSLNKAGLHTCIISIVPYRGNEINVISCNQTEYKILTSPIIKTIGIITRGVLYDSILKTILHRIFKRLGLSTIINQTYDIITSLPVTNEYRIFQVLNWSINGYEAAIEKRIKRKSYFLRILAEIFFRVQSKRRKSELKEMDGVVVLTNRAKYEIENFVDRKRILVIGNPVMHSEPSRQISNGRNKCVVFVGRLSEEKGCIRLLKIWKKISESLPDYILKIYGEGPLEREMRAIIAKEHLSNILFMGYEENKEMIYPCADLLLMTSDTESFGMVITEAMYYGVPSIAFDCPVAPKEIIGDSGMLIPCFDEEQYAEATIKALSNYKYWSLLHEKSQARSKDFYITTIIDSWKKLCS